MGHPKYAKTGSAYYLMVEILRLTLLELDPLLWANLDLENNNTN